MSIIGAGQGGPVMPLPWEHLPVPGNRVGPDGSGVHELFVLRSTIQSLEENGPEWKYQAGLFIPQAAQHPTVIFEGLKRPDMLDGHCYVTKPTPVTVEGGCTISPPSGMVFLVYVQGSIAF